VEGTRLEPEDILRLHGSRDLHQAEDGAGVSCPEAEEGDMEQRGDDEDEDFPRARKAPAHV
jgi:hypothetical protein